jgi:hypothetical protein
MVEAVVEVREAQEKAKSEMKRLGKVLEVPRVYEDGDLVWLYDPNPPNKGVGEDCEEEEPKKNKFKRFWTFWKGPYFVKGMEGSNVVLQAFEKDKRMVVHQNRVKRYIYPLRGLGAAGDARNGYLKAVLGHKKEANGLMEYKVIWQLQRGEKVEWVDESIVPLNLVLEYFDRLGIVVEDEKMKIDKTDLIEGKPKVVGSSRSDVTSARREIVLHAKNTPIVFHVGVQSV